MVFAAEDQPNLRQRLSTCQQSHTSDANSWQTLTSVADIIAGGMSVAIDMWPESLINILSDPRVRYLSLHDNRLAGAVVGPNLYADSERYGVDNLAFGPDGERLAFGALTLGGMGVYSYGSACVVLRNGAEVRDRTAFLERNSFSYKQKGPGVQFSVPLGSRALWQDAPALAVLKHEKELLTRNDWSGAELGALLIRSSGDKKTDEFIEAQIARPVTAGDFAKVTIDAGLYKYRGGGAGTFAELAEHSARLAEAVLSQARLAGIATEYRRSNPDGDHKHE